MGVEIKIVHPNIGGLFKVLHPGDEQEFGREIEGVGAIGEDRAISRRHGIVRATTDGFTVTSTGTRVGFVVADRTTPSKLHIARGIGPITVPFADCSIVVEHKRGRDYLNVTVRGSDAADRWARSWGPEMRKLWDLAPRRGIGTAAPWPTIDWKKANGKDYAWFTTLVALCEPAFGDAPAGTPTNPDLGRRLYKGHGVIERDLNAIYAAFGLEGRSRQREIIVSIAIAQGIVTREDIATLNPQPAP